jgi:hypothetical protein
LGRILDTTEEELLEPSTSLAEVSTTSSSSSSFGSLKSNNYLQLNNKKYFYGQMRTFYLQKGLTLGFF